MNRIQLILLIVATNARIVNHESYRNHHPLTIKVVGSGQVDLTPSFATIMFEVEIKDKDSNKALQKANSIMDLAVRNLKQSGKSSHLKISSGKFELEYSSQSYTVTNQLYVTTKDLEEIGDLVTVGVAAGLNKVHDVNFQNTVKQVSKATDKATQAAIKDAKLKAKHIAHSLNKKVVETVQFKIKEIQENFEAGIQHHYLEETISVFSGWGAPAAGDPATGAPAPAAGAAAPAAGSPAPAFSHPQPTNASTPTPLFSPERYIRVDIELEVKIE